MKNILIPTDFSENAWNAIKYALQMFNDEKCTFYFLNTYTPALVSSRFMAASFEGGVLSNAASMLSENGLKEILVKVEDLGPNRKHTYKTISSFSLLVDEVMDTVANYDIDLVVMGTKGATGLEEVFMGSNTVRIIKTVKDCPILAIPNTYEFTRPKEIAFATNFNRFYTKSELKPLVDMAASLGAVVRIVYVQYEIKALSELQQFNLSMLRKYLKDVEHYVHTVSELNSVSKTLEKFSEELGIHLLALLNFQHSYLERLTREPVVSRLAFHSKTPLFVIPELSMATQSRSKSQDEFTFSN
ncbi:universal stress protein [Maribacter sp. CXY002]|uniref:universal stress protein n=1 Tax=Maribacter luteocoastalis TaxID=3407671 RepID=UPI003B67E3BA